MFDPHIQYVFIIIFLPFSVPGNESCIRGQLRVLVLRDSNILLIVLCAQEL